MGRAALSETPLTGGLDESIDPRHLPRDRASVLQNVTFDKDGAYVQRPGFAALRSGPQAARRLLAYRDELLCSDGDSLHTYVPDDSYGWSAHDQVPQFTSTRELLTSGADVTAADVAIGSNPPYELFAWQQVSAVTSGVFSIHATLRNIATGALLFNGVVVSGAAANSYTQPRCAILDDVAMITYRRTGVDDVFMATLDLNNPVSASWSSVTLGQQLLNTAGYDMCAYPSGIAVIGDNPAAGDLAITTYSTAGATIDNGTITDASLAAVTGIAITYATHGVNSGFWVTYKISTPNVRTRFVNPTTFADIVAALSIFTTNITADTLTTVALNATEAVTVAGTSVAGAATSARMYWRIHNVSAAAVDVERNTRQLVPASKAFTCNGRGYLLVSRQAAATVDRNQESAWLCSLDTHLRTGSTATAPNLRAVATVAARTCKLLGGWIDNTTPTLGNVAACADGSSWIAALSTRLTLETDLNFPVASVTRALLRYRAPAAMLGDELGEHLYVPAGVPSYYDGSRVAEIGFLYQPDKPSCVAVLTGGAMAAGDYRYIHVFEQRDIRGVIHRSIPSTPSDVTAVASLNDQVDVTVRHLTLTARREGGDAAPMPQIFHVLYRTKVGGVAPYYRVTEEVVPFTNNNDIRGTTVTLRDGLADASLGAQLYTTGGVLENVNPPSFGALVVARNRVWGIDGKAVWYSKYAIPGEAPGFNEVLTFTIDDDARDLTAIGAVDEKTIVWKREATYAVTGDGPNDLGAANDLSFPQRLSATIGCVDQRSVVEAPPGLFFQSTRGLMLLTRGLEIVYVGSAVRGTLASFPVCTSAVHVPAANQVRFTLTASEGGYSGCVVVFDYERKRWSKWLLWKYDGTAMTAGLQSACLHPTYGYVVSHDQGNGATEVWAETASAWSDTPESGTAKYAPLLFETGWIPMGEGLLGEGWLQAVHVLGERLTAHGLSVSVAYDYAASYTALAFTEAEVTTIGTIEQVKVKPRQRARAVRVKIETTAPATVGTGRGASLAAYALEIEANPGPAALPSTSKK